MDPIFADIPDGPLDAIVVTGQDRRDWETWQIVDETFRVTRPQGTLMELARDGQYVFHIRDA